MCPVDPSMLTPRSHAAHNILCTFLASAQSVALQLSASSCMQGVHDEVLTLLDAAKLAQSFPPDLSRNPVHFVTLSFYKVFGYPTGIAALIVRTDVLPLLTPPFLGGGTLQATLPATWPSTPQARPGVAAFEPGTPNYQAILQLPAGFQEWQRTAVTGGGAARRVALAAQLARNLASTKHANDTPAVVVYARGAAVVPDGADSDCHGSIGIGEAAEGASQGATVAFNVHDAAGTPVSCHIVAGQLAAAGITVRAGCCCNPGACAALLRWSDADLRRQHANGWTCGGDVGVSDGRHVGVVRASLGAMSTAADTARLIAALRSAFVATAPGGRIAHEPSLATASARRQQISLAAIAVYPVKSCGGMDVSAWPLVASGLLLDRAFQIIDRGGHALTISRRPALAQIDASVDLCARTLTLTHAPRRSDGPPSNGEHDGPRTCGSRAAGRVTMTLPAHLLPAQLREASTHQSGRVCGTELADAQMQPPRAALEDILQTTSNGRGKCAMLVCSPVHASEAHCACALDKARQTADVTPMAEPSVHSWLSRVLNTECHLVCSPPANPAHCDCGAGNDPTMCSSQGQSMRWLRVGCRADAFDSFSADPAVCARFNQNRPGQRADARTGGSVRQRTFANAAALLVASTSSAAAFADAMRSERSKVESDSCTGATVPMRGDCVHAVCDASMRQRAPPWTDAMRRFRVNLMFDTQDGARLQADRISEADDARVCSIHPEDSWSCIELDIAGAHAAAGTVVPGAARVSLVAAGPAQRCAAVNVDWQARAREKGVCALKVLASYKRSQAGVTWGAYMRLAEKGDERAC